MERVILIADDEPLNLKLAGDLLRISGYKAVEAVDGQQAVSLARSLKPDLILMDLRMPLKNGYEALEILMEDENTMNIPVIAMSAMLISREKEKEKALKAGFKDFISKPYDLDFFLVMVKNYVPLSEKGK